VITKKDAEYLRKLIEEYADQRADLAVARMTNPKAVKEAERLAKLRRIELDTHINKLHRAD
jgi:hypothetical protein